MSMKKFEAPIMDIIPLYPADLLTTSADPFDGEYVPIGGGTPDEENVG